MKANACPALLKFLLSMGVGVDCVSPAEVRGALRTPRARSHLPNTLLTRCPSPPRALSHTRARTRAPIARSLAR